MLPVEVHCGAEDAEPLHIVPDHVLQSVGALDRTAVHCRTFHALVWLLYGSIFVGFDISSCFKCPSIVSGVTDN